MLMTHGGWIIAMLFDLKRDTESSVFGFQMLTLSTERFLKIQREAPAESQQYLVQVTKYQAAQSCKVG